MYKNSKECVDDFDHLIRLALESSDREFVYEQIRGIAELAFKAGEISSFKMADAV